MSIIDRLAKFFTPVKALPTGIYHLKLPVKDQEPLRLYLRLQNGGTGILIVNASTVLQLNPTAAEYAFHLIKGSEPAEVVKQVAERYRINKNQVLQDYNDFVEKILTMVHNQDIDPVSVLGFERIQPNSSDLSAPLRLDCALTYRLEPGENVELAPTGRVVRELTTDEWQIILDKAWAAGIPHVVFTGGEATLRDDLPALIAHSEKNGQVTGLITDGVKLADAAYLKTLLQTGLDHVMIILPVNADPDWQMLENAIKADIFLSVHITVTPQNVSHIQGLMDQLEKAGVMNISLTAAEASLHEQVIVLGNHAAEIKMRKITDLPVPYSEANPVALELSYDTEPQGAGKAWMYVEPDGDVLPAQGHATQVLGNFLNDSWEKISGA